MSIAHLVWREIRFRRLSFALAVVSTAVAVACVIGSQALLVSDENTTRRILAEKQAQVEQAVAQKKEAVEVAGKDLQDAIRKQMLGLGFNVLIVPQSQDLSELHLNGTLSETMPEEYVNKLANSKIVTVNHLLPSVSKRVQVDHGDKQLDIFLQGTRGEVPIMHRGLKKPLLDAVVPGEIVVGYEIHSQLGLKVGDSFSILGHDFEVSKLHPQRGSHDDVTVWIDLGQAQELLGMENLIHTILALECECAGDRISQIREEIKAILPGTRVIERYSRALTRAESRAKAKQVAEASLRKEIEYGSATLEREQHGRAELQDRHADLVSVLIPLVMIACAIWIALLSYNNVRQRRDEIGILRALGLGSRQLLGLFLSRAVLTGVVGGLVGMAIGLLIGTWLGDSSFLGNESGSAPMSSNMIAVVVLTMVMAPFFSVIASWLPAMMATNQDPATVLQEN